MYIFNVCLFIGSSWSVVKFLQVNIKMTKAPGLVIGCPITLPKAFKNKQGILNLKTAQDNFCFVYLVIAVYMGVIGTKTEKNIKQYKQFFEENWDETTKVCKYIDFTMLNVKDGVELDQIEAFEEANSEFSINIFLYDDKDKSIYPHKIENQEKGFHMDLLLLQKQEKAHFVLIYDFDLFLSKKGQNKRRHCKRCLTSHKNTEALYNHLTSCKNRKPMRMVFPESNYVEYKILGDQCFFPRFVVADFESYLNPVHGEYFEERGITARHLPISVAYALIEGEKVVDSEFISGKEVDKVKPTIH
jgi:hypothetical protein